MACLWMDGEGVENGKIVSTNKWSKLKHGIMSHGDWPMSKTQLCGVLKGS